MLFSVNKKKIRIINSLLFLSFAFCTEQSAINSKIYFDFIRQEDGSNAFGIKRAYFTYKNKMSSDLSFTLQTDVDYKAEPKSIYLKKANASWKTRYGKLSIGILGMNMFNVQEKTWGNRFIAKTAMDRNKYSSSAGLGIGFSRDLTESIYISSMVTNGSGYKSSENDKYKKISIQLVSGEKNLSKNEGINFGTVLSYEPFHEDSVSRVIGAFAGYYKNPLRIGIEYTTLSKQVDQSLVSGYINWKMNSPLSLYWRYDLHMVKSESESHMIVGCGYRPRSGLIIAPNFRITNEGDEFVSEIAINFQFSF